MKKLLLLLSVLFATIALAEPNGGCNFVTGSPHCMAYTGRALVLGTQGPQNLYFKTNDVLRGYFDGSTGALTSVTMSAPNLLNNSYLTATDAAGTGTINILKIDASDDLIINSDASDVIKLQLESDTNRRFTFAAASDTAHTLTFGDGGTTAAQTLTISGSTADADDDSVLNLAGGGSCSATRGGCIKLFGNEDATSFGGIDIYGGDVVGSSNVRVILGSSTSEFRVRKSDSTTALTVNGAGNLVFGNASAKIIPGATSLLFQNNADSATNLTITDAGAISTRNASGAYFNVQRDSYLGSTITSPTDIEAVLGASYRVLVMFDPGSNGGLGVAARANSATGSRLDFFKGRGVSDWEGNTILNSGDQIGKMLFYGANGTNYSNAAEIRITVDGTPGASNDMPGAIDFLVAPDGSATPASAFKILNSGAFTSPIITSPNVIGGSAMPSQVSTAAGSASALTIIRPTGNAHFVGFEYGADTSGVTSRYLKSRSATATGSGVVSSGDTIANFIFGADDGDSITNAASIKVEVDGTPGDGDMPGSIDFQLSPDGSGTVASVLKLSNTKAAQFTGTIRSSATSDLGWSVVNAANQACNTTCTSACVFGMNTGALGNLLACTDATADTCVCAGAS